MAGGLSDSCPAKLQPAWTRRSYNALIDTGRFVIASASPELFFETAGKRLRMKPMKGTTRRGVAKLRASPKERAENIMIVDMVRNDVAKPAVPGGVAVTALCQAEQYGTVHQLTSEVTAVLRPGVGIEHHGDHPEPRAEP